MATPFYISAQVARRLLANFASAEGYPGTAGNAEQLSPNLKCTPNLDLGNCRNFQGWRLRSIQYRLDANSIRGFRRQVMRQNLGTAFDMYNCRSSVAPSPAGYISQPHVDHQGRVSNYKTLLLFPMNEENALRWCDECAID